MSLQAYQNTQNATDNPRTTEYRLIASVTNALIEADGQTGPEFYQAVDWNRRVWLNFQVDLTAADNALPDDLKAKLISVAIWVDKHSTLVLRGEERIAPLIEINRTIMEGLAN
jgi:flagellar protein FlaF